MNVSEHDATVAVEAAARKAYDTGREEAVRRLAPEYVARLSDWDDISPFEKTQWRTLVLPTVWAALDALPDNRWAIWNEGRHALAVKCGCDVDVENPYPL